MFQAVHRAVNVLNTVTEFLSREKNFRELLENRFSRKKLSRICGNPVHHAH